MEALAWLIRTGARNRLRRRLRRARQPRYLLAMLAGLAYFWLLLWRRQSEAPIGAIPLDGTVHLTYALALAMLAASWWILGSDEPALHFTGAEVQMLFPAPLSRRALVLYRLIQTELVVLVSALIWTLLLARMAGPPLLRGVAFWVVLTTLYLHRVGASLTRASAVEHGVAGLRRAAAAIVVVGGGLVAVLWSVVALAPVLRAELAAGRPFAAAGNVLAAPAVKLVLFPFRMLLAPIFAATPGEWLRMIWPAALLMAAHVPWILRADTAFEESAADAAMRRARSLDRARQPGSPAARGAGRWRIRLPLRPTGRPAVAIIWKNVLAMMRTMSARTILPLVVLLIVAVSLAGLIAPDARGALALVGTAALALAALLAVLGPLWLRNDLRLDMLSLEVLRTAPLRGATLVRAEIAGSTLLLTTAQLALTTLAFVAVPRGTALALLDANRSLVLVCLVLTLPALNAAGLTIQNAAALLFPGWLRLGLTRPTGIEALGQGILTGIGSLLSLFILVALPLLIAGSTAWIVVSAVGVWAFVPCAVFGSLLVLAELWGMTAWMGRVFERTEPLEAQAR